MNQPIHFCRSWFRAKKKPTQLWSAEKAEAAHRSRAPYTALIGSLEAPYCFVDVAAKVIGTGFLDSRLRESLTYAFKEVAPGRLFLSMAIHREFEACTDKVGGAVAYTFDQDGTVQIRREHFNPHLVESATSSFDPAPNYSARPAFAHYNDLIRIERCARAE
jgi:hypothetical protein